MNATIESWMCRGGAMLLVWVAAMMCGTRGRAQIIPGAVPLPDSIAGVLSLSSDRAYQITGVVKVGPGGLLSIPDGTLIHVSADGAGARLQVERGGRIHVRGTALHPVIFTSAKPQGARLPGDWGGIVILGRGGINVEADTAALPVTGGIFGGGDDLDSSGVISFVRIEYAGAEVAPGVHMAGLTLAGVGSRTVIDNVQIAYSGGDSYAWLGGRSPGRNLVAFAGTGDDFAFDLGYRGRVQFGFALRDSTRFSPDTSRALESANDAAGSSRTPLTRPILSNMTLAGPFRNDAQPAGYFGGGAYLYRNGRLALCNSVIVGWQEGIRAGGAGIAALPPGCPQPADLRLRNNVISSQTVVWGVDGVGLLDMVLLFLCHPNANPGDHPNAGIRGVTQTQLNAPDPRPFTDSPAASGADFTDTILATGDGFAFTPTTYRGAFDPNLPRERQWDSLWTNYHPNSTTYVKHPAGWNLVALANAPSSVHKDSVYRAATSNAFRFDGNGYVVDNMLDAGVGYWLTLGDDRTIEQVGTAVALPRTIAVAAGWNLISSGAGAPAPVANVTAAGTTILSSFFEFRGGYTPATIIEPGHAYWVNVSTAGTLTLHP